MSASALYSRANTKAQRGGFLADKIPGKFFLCLKEIFVFRNFQPEDHTANIATEDLEIRPMTSSRS
jgi:hypothetical protein